MRSVQIGARTCLVCQAGQHRSDRRCAEPGIKQVPDAANEFDILIAVVAVSRWISQRVEEALFFVVTKQPGRHSRAFNNFRNSHVTSNSYR